MKILIGVLMGFLALTLVTPLVSASTLSTGLWVSTANLNAARRDAGSVRLQDGKVLVIGGWNAASLATEPFASAELYDPVADSWSYAASMSAPRTFPTATLLKSGKVLVTGGAKHENDWLASAELYDPTHNTWTSAGNLPVGVYEQSATLLSDGSVLVAGGSATGNVSTNVASIYDPTSNSWTQVASMTYPRLAHTATLLKSDKVLVDGGWSTQTGGTESSAELYDPVANTWSSAGSPAARDQQSAVLLSNGNVLVVGGEDGSHNPLAVAELYNPKTNTWQTAPSMTYPRYRTSAVLLDNGLVLVPGGTDGPPFGFASGLNVVELYNPSTHSWTIGPSMPIASNFFTVNVLRDGYVLLAGGDDNGALSSTQLYVPAPF